MHREKAGDEQSRNACLEMVVELRRAVSDLEMLADAVQIFDLLYVGFVAGRENDVIGGDDAAVRQGEFERVVSEQARADDITARVSNDRLGCQPRNEPRLELEPPLGPKAPRDLVPFAYESPRNQPGMRTVLSMYASTNDQSLGTNSGVS